VQVMDGRPEQTGGWITMFLKRAMWGVLGLSVVCGLGVYAAFALFALEETDQASDLPLAGGTFK